MHRLESEVDEAGKSAKDRKSHKSTGGGKYKSKDIDLFGELDKVIGDNFDVKDLKKFTGENPAEWLIYKRACVSRISARACMDVITPSEEDDEDETKTTRNALRIGRKQYKKTLGRK